MFQQMAIHVGMRIARTKIRIQSLLRSNLGAPQGHVFKQRLAHLASACNARGRWDRDVSQHAILKECFKIVIQQCRHLLLLQFSFIGHLRAVPHGQPERVEHALADGVQTR